MPRHESGHVLITAKAAPTFFADMGPPEPAAEIRFRSPETEPKVESAVLDGLLAIPSQTRRDGGLHLDPTRCLQLSETRRRADTFVR
jgi:hypothetical protein